jgi:hypothetical protein
MIVVYSGRRTSSITPAHLEQTAQRLSRLLAALRPSAVVGAAADGADLLVLEAALGLREKIVPHVILPTPPEEFRAHSVDQGWRERHDRALLRVSEIGTVESLGLPNGTSAYRAANIGCLQRAKELAEDDEGVLALVIASPGEGAMVEDFRANAELRGVPVIRIDPAIDQRARPLVFVACPFGSKFDPERRRAYNCDELYEKVLVPALENAQLRYLRADEEIHSGFVLQPMLEAIQDADMVIADLATGNFNVGWELGLRHLLRTRHTLLLAPDGVAPPFDLSPLRRVPYEQTNEGISDSAAIAAMEAIEPYLRELDSSTMTGSDSPVEVSVGVQSWAVLRRPGVPGQEWTDLRERLALARDLRDTTMTLEVIGQAQGLDARHRDLLAAEAGALLVRLGEYADGARLLEPIVESDPAATRPQAHVFLAQALYRPQDADVGALDRAEAILERLLEGNAGPPELWAAIGAISKRRSRRRDSDGARRADIRRALYAYATDYENDLNAYYEGVNVVACGLLLEQAHGDAQAGGLARAALPAVDFAARTALRHQPHEYWPAATVAELLLYRSVLDLRATVGEVAEAYTAAGALAPARGSVHSSVTQLEWLGEQGLDADLTTSAADALVQSAGYPDLAPARRSNPSA